MTMLGRKSQHGIAWLLLSLALCNGSAAEDALTLNDFVSVQRIGALSFSSRGLRLTWDTAGPATEKGAQRRVWLAEVPSKRVRQIEGAGGKDYSPKWLPDGSTVS